MIIHKLGGLKLYQTDEVEEFRCAGSHIASSTMKVYLDGDVVICDGCIVSMALRIASVRRRNDKRSFNRDSKGSYLTQ